MEEEEDELVLVPTCTKLTVGQPREQVKGTASDEDLTIR